jgi:hypothetical protein
MGKGRLDLGPFGLYGYLKNILMAEVGGAVTYPEMASWVTARLKTHGHKPVTDQAIRFVVDRMVASGLLELISKFNRAEKRPARYRINPIMAKEDVVITKKVATTRGVGRSQKAKGTQVSLALDSIDIGVNALVEEFRAKIISEKMPVIVAKIRNEQESAITLLSERITALKKMADDLDSKAYLKSVGQEKRADAFLKRAETAFKHAEEIRRRASAKVTRLDRLSGNIAKDIKSRIAEIELAKAEISRIGCTDCNIERRRLREISDKLRQETQASIRKVRTGDTAVHVTGRDELPN